MTCEQILELYRQQIAFLRAELERLEAQAHGGANVSHEWSSVYGSLRELGPRDRFETLTEAQRACDKWNAHPDTATPAIVQHRLVTAWEDIQ